jgi:hypothetical protein
MTDSWCAEKSQPTAAAGADLELKIHFSDERLTVSWIARGRVARELAMPGLQQKATTQPKKRFFGNKKLISPFLPSPDNPFQKSEPARRSSFCKSSARAQNTT